MAQKIAYPSSIINISGQGDTIPFRKCNNMDNLKNDTSSVATWGSSSPGRSYANAIAGRNGSRYNPSSIEASGFNFNIPDSAKVTSITVEYAYRKRSYSTNTSEGTHGSFGGVEIHIAPFGWKKTGYAAPRNNFGYYSTSWTGLNIKGSEVNSNNFKVWFDIPKNTSTNPAYIEMIYLRVRVNYDDKNYVASINISPSELNYNDTANVTCTVTETSNTMSSEKVDLTVNAPNGFSVTGFTSNPVSVVTENGKGKFSYSFKVSDASKEGLYDVSFKENTTNHTATTTFLVRKPTIKVEEFRLINNEVEISTSNKTNNALLEVSLSSSAPVQLDLSFDFDGLSYSNISLTSGKLTVNAEDWIKSKDSYLYSKTIQLYSTTAKDYLITMVSDVFVDTYSQTLTLITPAVSEPYFTVLNLNEFTLNNLKDGERYVFTCLGRLNSATNVLNGLKNNRVSVCNGVETFTNKINGVDLWEELKCEFTYNSNYPIFLVFYGNFIEYDDGTQEYGNLLLMPESSYKGYEYPVMAFSPLTNLLDSTSMDYANILLEPPEKANSTRHYFDTFDWQNIEKSSVLIHGIEIEGDISSTAPVQVVVGLGTDDDDADYNFESVYIDEEVTSFSIGGLFHTFGFDFPDINDLLPNLKFFIQIDDAYDNITPFNVDLKNIRVSIYYSLNNGEDCDFYIDGISCKYYLVRLNPETVIPRGSNFDSEIYKVKGADGEYPAQVNIKNNKLSLSFYVIGDDFEDSTNILGYVTNYLYPDRDSLNNPLLKSISFFFDKEHCYDYYIEDNIDSKPIPGGYECSVDLIVPSGLQRSVEKVNSGYAGQINTIGKIKPEIYLYKVRTSDDVEGLRIIESFTGKILTLKGEFINNLPEFTNIKIDCETRKVYYEQYGEWFLIDPNYIGLDSEFFTLTGGFNFESSVNCKVNRVVYYDVQG